MQVTAREIERQKKLQIVQSPPRAMLAQTASMRVLLLMIHVQRFSNRKRKQITRLIRHMWSAIMMQGEKKMLQMANLKIQRRNGREGKRKKKILKL